MLAIFWGIIIIILILFIHKEGLARNKKDIKKYIYMFLIFITTSIIVYALISKIEFFQKVFSTSKYLIYDKIVVFVLSMSIAILLIGLLAPFIQKLYETSVITRYERKHKHEKHQYYRDIVKSESPAILSYCYNKKINIEDAVVAILLNLNMKNIISIDEDNIIILKNTNKLYSHEEYVINNIKKSADKTFKKEFKEKLIKDLIKNKYVKKINPQKVNIIYFMEFFILWMILYGMISLVIFMALSSIFHFIIFAYFLSFIEISLFKNAYKNINPIIRTKKALELTGKLIGLKNYIKDFSSIKDNGTEYINLYDEYVLYAIIFDIKGKLNDECNKIYKDLKKFSSKKISYN